MQKGQWRKFTIFNSRELLAYRRKADCVKLVGVEGWFVEKVSGACRRWYGQVGWCEGGFRQTLLGVKARLWKN